jgi:hypothetical protein
MGLDGLPLRTPKIAQIVGFPMVSHVFPWIIDI